MRFLRIILRGTLWRWRTNLAVAATVLITTSVLTGALLSQDSVQASLRKAVYGRLGGIEFAADTRDRFFTAELASKVEAVTGADAASVISVSGSAGTIGNSPPLPRVNIYGVDSHFYDFADVAPKTVPDTKSVFINERLSQDLGVNAGDSIVLRIASRDAMPNDAPFGSDPDNNIVMRVMVSQVLEPNHLSDFSLRANQVAAHNVFMSREVLAEALSIGDKANLLVAGISDISVLDNAIDESWTLADFGLAIRSIGDQIELVSDRVFIEDVVSSAAISAGGYPTVSYFVDSIHTDTSSIPYSFVAAEGENDTRFVAPGMILLNEWAQNELGAAVGDNISLRYRVPDENGTLIDNQRIFVVAAITDIRSGDKWYMPPYPGFEGVENCRDWDLSAPIDLSLIEDRDEDYWDLYGGSPKAFISISDAQEMWSNTYGSATSYRFGSNDVDAACIITKKIGSGIVPRDIGFTVQPVKIQGIAASAGGTDFGQLFLGLSMFLLASAITLTGLIFSLSASERAPEIATLSSVGYSSNVITALMAAEGSFVAFVGAAAGAVTGIFYNRLIIAALRTVWSDAVRFSGIAQDVSAGTVLISFAIGFFISLFVIILGAKKLAWQKPEAVRKQHVVRKGGKIAFVLVSLKILSVVLLMAAVALPMLSREIWSYLSAGGCLFISLLLGFWIWLSRTSRHMMDRRVTIVLLGIANSVRRRGRSMAAATIVAAGVFIVILVGANSHVQDAAWGSAESGTGGFEFLVETTIPLSADLSDTDTLRRYRLDQTVFDRVNAISMKARDGDDASCLNLNMVEQPRVLGVDPALLSGTFSFSGFMAGLDVSSDPWSVLSMDFGPDTIPAVIDQTVLTWGLGKKLGDALVYEDEAGREVRIILAAGLENSIFQGSVLIAENSFRTIFPSIGGKHVFLLDVPDPLSEQVKFQLGNRLVDNGVRIQSAETRLAELYSVENTYLAIFMILGWLGVLLGTVGLGAVAYRNIAESSADNAVLAAIGIPESIIRRIALWEHLPPALAGVVIGSLSATIAAIPSATTRGGEFSFLIILAIVVSVALSSVLWIRIAIGIGISRFNIRALREE